MPILTPFYSNDVKLLQNNNGSLDPLKPILSTKRKTP